MDGRKSWWWSAATRLAAYRAQKSRYRESLKRKGQGVYTYIQDIYKIPGHPAWPRAGSGPAPRGWPGRRRLVFRIHLVYICIYIVHICGKLVVARCISHVVRTCGDIAYLFHEKLAVLEIFSKQ